MWARWLFYIISFWSILMELWCFFKRFERFRIAKVGCIHALLGQELPEKPSRRCWWIRCLLLCSTQWNTRSDLEHCFCSVIRPSTYQFYINSQLSSKSSLTSNICSIWNAIVLTYDLLSKSCGLSLPFWMLVPADICRSKMHWTASTWTLLNFAVTISGFGHPPRSSLRCPSIRGIACQRLCGGSSSPSTGQPGGFSRYLEQCSQVIHKAEVPCTLQLMALE